MHRNVLENYPNEFGCQFAAGNSLACVVHNFVLNRWKTEYIVRFPMKFCIKWVLAIQTTIQKLFCFFFNICICHCVALKRNGNNSLLIYTHQLPRLGWKNEKQRRIRQKILHWTTNPNGRYHNAEYIQNRTCGCSG